MQKEKDRTERLDHTGLVAGMIDELDIVKIIDEECGEQAKNKWLTFGEATKCMLINCLGFVSRTLYMYSEFFEGRPTRLLLGKEVPPEKIDDHLLGRTLDKLYQLGVSELFMKIAFRLIRHLGITPKSLHLDSTSFHLDGKYGEEKEGVLHITHGYSRDHRPDLKQVILQLVVSSQGNLPLMMHPDHGNKDDKTGFQDLIKSHIQSLQQGLNTSYLIADSALYTADNVILMDNHKTKFITRVPSKLLQCQSCLAKHRKLEEYGRLENGYRFKEVKQTYGGVSQRWILIHSEQAEQREQKSLARKIEKGIEQDQKTAKQLAALRFSCKKDAEAALTHFRKKLKWSQVVSHEFTEHMKHKRGRPKKEEKPDQVSYQIIVKLEESKEKREKAVKNAGFFVLGTNEMQTLSPKEILQEYKGQQHVERGFRFCKSSHMSLSAFFLKKPERIEALLMIMSLSLLVYSALEYRIRHELVAQKQTFPNQKKKPTQKPTCLWVFFCFCGLELMILDNQPFKISNIKERNRIIINILGKSYQNIYYEENWSYTA